MKTGMKKKATAVLTAAALMFVMSALAINSSSAQNTNSSTTQGGMMMKKMSSMDQKFMAMAAVGGMAEVEMGRVALEKSSSDAVKQYAQKMIDDHTMAGDELKRIATEKGVMLPTQLDAKHAALVAKLQKAPAASFDAMYTRESGVKAHEKMEKLFMDESMKGMDADVKGFAAKTLPTVKMHLQMARDMAAGKKHDMTKM